MVIVSKTLYWNSGTSIIPIQIDIQKPCADRNLWRCRYDVDWPEGLRVFHSCGSDALQALVHALQMIGAEIYSSSYHQSGRLSAGTGEAGYGFPVANSIRDLLVGVDRITL